MGILNVTPDSFSDGGEATSLDAAVKKGLQLVADGADILDIGGESTRPGAEPVSLEDELQRVIPAIEALSARTEVPISIDTTKAEVARQAIQAGAVIINDISGLTFDPAMIPVAAETKAGVIC
ncbi:MAG: dihydropteroate synthase, partial [Planctomycetaceae bacterium]|nr:dihydropteroate synthase [Planctomycetaceae bacterium]